MSEEHLAPDEVQRGIERCVGQHPKYAKKLHEALQASAMAEAEYKVGFAKARLEARASAVDRKMTETEADDIATVQTEDLRMEHETTKAMAEAYRRKLFSIENEQNGYQSLLRYYLAAGA